MRTVRTENLHALNQVKDPRRFPDGGLLSSRCEERSGQQTFHVRPDGLILAIREEQLLELVTGDSGFEQLLIDAPEHQERIRTMRNRLWDLLEASDAMSTPLRRGTGQQNQRKGGG